MARLIGALAVTVSPKPAFAEWVKYIFNFNEIDLPKDDDQYSGKFEADWIFVFPMQADANACLEFVRRHHLEMFEAILSTWDADKRLWPKDLSYDLFEKYFALTFHSAVYDVTSE